MVASWASRLAPDVTVGYCRKIPASADEELLSRAVMKPETIKTRSFTARHAVVNLDWWNAAWLGALALSSGILLVASIPVTGAALMALLIMAVAPVVGLVTIRWQVSWAEPLLLWVWGLCATVAVLLTGGVPGSVAVWLLAPLAAASAMSRPARLALGVAVSLSSLGAALLGGWALALPPSPDFLLAQMLGLTSLLTTSLGFGTALILLHRSLETGRRHADRAQVLLRQAVSEQPHLLVTVDAAGHLTGAWGRMPQGLATLPAANRALSLIATSTEQICIEQSVARAFADGSATVRFSPVGSDVPQLELSLNRVSPGRLIGTIADVADQLARESQLETARAEAEAQNAGKSRFLANMSHELRTPLNAIMGFADIMKQKLFGPLPDRYGDYPDLIHESGAHLLELINDVLDMSKIEAERYEINGENFDAREAINAVLRLMRGQADRAGVHLRAQISADPIEVFADRRALKQIALNLISNALKFTPKGGSVTVSLRGIGPSIEVLVADTGSGIAKGDLERLGQPYEQAGDTVQRAAGTGLGLSLVRALAELHGGEMVIESQLGQGTAVTVRMPVIRSMSPVAPETQTATVPH